MAQYPRFQLAIAMDTRTRACMTRRSMQMGYHWTFMDDMMAAAFARSASTTPKASIVTNANRDSIGQATNNGMKPMSANVGFSFNSVSLHCKYK